MSIDPRAPAPVLRTSVQTAALRQLTAAIAMWFDYGDPVSIHTLAAAANGCYHALGDNKGVPTAVETWIKSLSRTERIDVRRAQNFFKHGPDRNDPSEVRFRTEHAELLILDCIVSHEELCPPRTPLMTCFFTRLAFENPGLLEHMNVHRRQQGREDFQINEMANWDRVNFLQRALPTFAEIRPGT